MRAVPWCAWWDSLFIFNINSGIKKLGSVQSLFNSPTGFLSGLANSTKKILGGVPTYVVGFSAWKGYLRKYFPTRVFHFLPKDITQQEFDSTWRPKMLAQSKSEFLVWGIDVPGFISEFAKQNNKKIQYIEDGFIRSVGIGSEKVPALSLTVDSRTPYFNAREASDLEVLLSTYNFAGNRALLKRASAVIDSMKTHGISKYNQSPQHNMDAVYGKKTVKRVLVIGQVEDDASIIYGCSRPFTNNQLVKLAAEENPGARIYYKVHPDVASGNRPSNSNPDAVKNICTIIKHDISLPQALHEVDHVYTITSLSGFEALLRGIKVTAVGSPFYAGWGLTDDRQACPRRTRKLTVEELFAGAYLLYAKYFNPTDGRESSVEAVINIIQDGMSKLQSLPQQTTKPIVPAPKARAATAPAKAAVRATPTAPAKAKAKPAVSYNDVPTWFNTHPGVNLKAALKADKPVFLYVPWITGHGDTLIEKITHPTEYTIAPFDFIRDIEVTGIRQDVTRFNRNNPALYRKMLISRLVPLRSKISGIIFTFDWFPAMRMIASVCDELDIPKILIPHESVFVDRDKYYWDSVTQSSVPIADEILGWGGMQRDIFVERGYPADRFKVVGAPKFDIYTDYKPALTRTQFCKLFGLNPSKKVILFASQPLDSQLDKKVAQESQRRAIQDLLTAARLNNAQLIVRLPPNKEDILGPALRAIFKKSNDVVADDGTCYLVTPEEALHHSDLVTSVNSTMLFEALLAGTPALSVKYVAFDQIWTQAGIPAVENSQDLDAAVTEMLSGDWKPSEEGMAWAANMFGKGDFDGQAATRIQEYLLSVATLQHKIPKLPSAAERVFSNMPVDVIAIPSSDAVLDTFHCYVPRMLRARTCLSTAAKTIEAKGFASVDVFFQWGIAASTIKTRQRGLATELGRPLVYLEDGFIRSVDIGLSKEPGLSLILDDLTAYYDATQPSRLENLLQSEEEVGEEKISRSRSAMDKIVKNRVSKYNHAPDIKLTIGTPGRKKVLLIDQRYGDQSVASGLGSDAAFDQMLRDALRDCADCDILIKQHPDAIKGGKSSYFSNEKIAFTQYMNNVFPILFDVNPYALFELVDEVYVVTSGMGFEALLAGKKVHCYGVPFYSGWGVTVDQQPLDRRSNTRSVEEIFHYAYIESSRYFNPHTGNICEVEDLVDYIVSARGW